MTAWPSGRGSYVQISWPVDAPCIWTVLATIDLRNPDADIIHAMYPTEWERQEIDYGPDDLGFSEADQDSIWAALREEAK